MHPLVQGFYETPPLWTNSQFGLEQFDFPEIQFEQQDGFVPKEGLRLGHQMEGVFEWLLEKSGRYGVLASNLLVEEGKLRIGELDFIVKEQATEAVFHVELAFKFYLIDSSISEPIYRLVGPNKKDMFFTKLEKLKSKQFPLRSHPSLTDLWSRLDVALEDVVSRCCFKAQLFEPYSGPVSIRPLNTSCILGQWITFEDFESNSFRSAKYYIPYKSEWPLRPHPAVVWMTHFEALMEVNIRMVKKQSPLLWVKDSDGALSKLLVVWW
ncbi:MAG: DUF1853 family protein [Flavobacteriaceae bacterium]|nr:DUF1853 family protein [Flavobacteriaceae bacterium]